MAKMTKTTKVAFCDPASLPADAAALRWDLAWPLFFPMCAPGTLPADVKPMLQRSPVMARWYWEQMGWLTGRLHVDAPEVVWFATPPLSEEAREYLTRLASFWCDEVYWEAPGPGAQNRWMAPVMALEASPTTPLLGLVHEPADTGAEQFLSPATGVGRLFLKVQEVSAGASSARLHSHSAADEYYVILKGSGTLRMGRHRQLVSAGTLIAKPTGPGLSTHILADRGEPVTILDIEAYPDARLEAGLVDAMIYADQREVVLFGPGLNAMVPQAAMADTADVFGHYFDGYVRQADGGFVPEAFPAQPPRQD